MSKPVIAASFSFPHEAQIARATLEAAGIPTHVADEHTINMDWLYSNALGGVKVLVSPEHLEEAKNLLNQDFSSEVEAEAGSEPQLCPKCRGENVIPYTMGKKPAFIVFIFLGFPLFFYKRGLKCEDCGEFWKT